MTEPVPVAPIPASPVSSWRAFAQWGLVGVGSMWASWTILGYGSVSYTHLTLPTSDLV